MSGSSSGRRSSRDRSERRTSASNRSRARSRRARAGSDDDLELGANPKLDSGFDSGREVSAPPVRKRPARRGAQPAAVEPARTGFAAKFARVDTKRALVITAVVVFLALTLAVPVRTYLSQRSEFDRLRQENAALTAEVAELEKQVTEQNDPAYIETQARKRLQYVKRGERQVVVIAPNREQQDAAAAAERERAENPWYQNMWDAVSTPPEGS